MTTTWYLVRAQRRHQDHEKLTEEELLLTPMRNLRYFDRRRSRIADRTEPALLDYSWVPTLRWAELELRLRDERLPPVHRVRNASALFLVAPLAVVADVQTRALAGEWDEDLTRSAPNLKRGDRVEIRVDSVGLVLGVVRHVSSAGLVRVATDWGPTLKVPPERVDLFNEKGWRERHREAAAEEAETRGLRRAAS